MNNKGSFYILNKTMKLSEIDFIAKYGHIKVVFCDYYKYEFSFECTFENKKINVFVGGDTSIIYRFSVDANKDYLISDLYIFKALVFENDKLIHEFNRD